MEKLEKNTYGKTPAAIYLAEVMSNHPQKVRMVGKTLNSYRTALADLEKSYEAGTMQKRTFGRYLGIERLKLAQTREYLKQSCDELVVNLVLNVMTGDLNRLLRIYSKMNSLQRSTLARAMNVYKQAESKPEEVQIVNKEDGSNIAVKFINNSTAVLKEKLKFSDIPDVITAETLMEKSLTRLNRLGKSTSYYD